MLIHDSGGHFSQIAGGPPLFEGPTSGVIGSTGSLLQMWFRSLMTWQVIYWWYLWNPVPRAAAGWPCREVCGLVASPRRS